MEVLPGDRVLPAQPSPAHDPFHEVIDFGRLDQVSSRYPGCGLLVLAASAPGSAAQYTTIEDVNRNAKLHKMNGGLAPFAPLRTPPRAEPTEDLPTTDSDAADLAG
jgi:hypothetical protein